MKTHIFIYFIILKYIQGDLRGIMGLTKFVMQPTIHVPHGFLFCFLIIPHNDFD
jgi:hypothetical protein